MVLQEQDHLLLLVVVQVKLVQEMVFVPVHHVDLLLAVELLVNHQDSIRYWFLLWKW